MEHFPYPGFGETCCDTGLMARVSFPLLSLPNSLGVAAPRPMLPFWFLRSKAEHLLWARGISKGNVLDGKRKRPVKAGNTTGWLAETAG